MGSFISSKDDANRNCIKELLLTLSDCGNDIPSNALLADTQIPEELDQQKHIRIPAYTNLPFLAVGGVPFLPLTPT